MSMEFPAWPQFDDTERAALVRALDQGQWWRIGGAEVRAFEAEFAAAHGAKHALAVTNGTQALQLGLDVLGLAPGDEVLVPAFTFLSSSLAVQALGGVPVPVDVDPDTYCIDPAAAAAAVTARTRAIMPVHMAGQLADMDAMDKLAADAGARILQDAAHAHAARWRGRRVGELGSVAAFSFQNGKLMTAGEGGALLFDDDELHREAYLRHSCGRPAEDRLYKHTTTGSNLRLGEFAAAVLRAQLSRLEDQVSTREARWAVLRPLLAAIPGVRPQGSDDRCDRNPHYMAMFRVPDLTEELRNRLVDRLVDRGLPAFVAFRAIYRTDGFWAGATEDTTVDELAERCPNTDAISRDCVWLHHRVLLGTEEQMHAVAGVLTEELARL
ncbi:MAG TPA: aminotransferase class I/II-fold pyridoxal phosphate-dependent enzyme [Actinophytocola sp.]|uniref:aminotransferase class I/II-fold pyridoxal phosphate-dependent enzyme n=1 Tax=Actinophytocola sp. TaxID=1872138 RepID=UPI002DB5D649|nr:aminotransferase class I/II-fold pyridoxal phosphate-dependent enzyme [Actinophytocola sp.]HEU5473564.1 aminotransferase class I/II-fold pyridoxal phosphate-dependent enzyme [Actinophytocola sp.]